MFVLKALKDAVFGRGERSDLVQIPSGQLFYVDSRNTKNATVCIFNAASATVRRHPVQPFVFELVVSRVFADGEQDLIDNGEDGNDGDGLNDDDEKTFLVDQALEFRRIPKGVDDDGDKLVWADLSGRYGTAFYEFVVDPRTGSLTVEAFLQTIYNCMFERKYQRGFDEEADSFDEFEVPPISSSLKSPFGSPLESPPASSSLEKGVNRVQDRRPEKGGQMGTPVKDRRHSGLAPMSLVNTPVSNPKIQSQSQNTSLTNSQMKSLLSSPMSAKTAPVGETLIQAQADLYMWDIRSNTFSLVAPACIGSLSKVGDFAFWLNVAKSDASEHYVGQPLESRMNTVFNGEHMSICWNYFTDQNLAYSFSMKFMDVSSAQGFRDMFGQCMYESLNKERFEKAVKVEDRGFVLDAYQEDIEMMDIDEPEESSGQEEDEEDEDDDSAAAGDGYATGEGFQDKQKNSQLAVGYAHDRSFVVRGDKIGVFKHTDDTNLQFDTTINNVSTLNNKLFSPRKVMLHNQDTSLLMMKPGDEHKIYRMDLERGKVVEEWDVDDVVPITEMIPDSKYAQMTTNQTLIGLSHNSIFRIDPRKPGTKRVAEEAKDYKTKTDFSCAAVSGKGDLAVGSNKGDIRLYNSLNKIAKTALPGLGDPIIGIDATENGRWIIATCKTYLLLIDTLIHNGKDEGSLGFSKRMGQNKPAPRRLQLKPEHVAMMAMPLLFTTAKFSTGPSETQEHSIVTSSGPFVISWDFKKVQKGKLDAYHIKKYADTVVADSFRWGQDQSIIVALPDDVAMIKKSQLQTPTKVCIRYSCFIEPLCINKIHILPFSVPQVSL